MTRNNSTTLALVNTLPPEMLARIFVLSKPFCSRRNDDGIDFHDLAAVCSYWRRVAINTPELWVHIDIGPSIPIGFTELLLKRAGDSSIYIHLNEANTSEPKSTSMEKIDQTMRLFCRHLHHISVLDINSENSFPDFITCTLNTWLECNGKNFPRSLMVYFPNANSVLSFSDALEAEPLNAAEILRLLTTVHLENICFNWNSVIYLNLTDLRLVFSCGKGDFPISTLEFTNILIVSPELEILKLENLEIFETENWAGGAPITMRRLSVLNLVQMDPDCLQLLLPLITLSGPLPEISLGIAVSSQMRDEFEAFLVRSKVTTLYCTEHEDSYSESFPLPSRQLLGDLHILVLDNVSIAEMMSGRASRRTSQPSPHPLSTTLLYCTVNLDTLKAFILDYDIRFLRFEICQLDPVAKDDFQDLSGLRYSLLKTFPELDCTISDEGSAWDLACCKMYDSPI